MWIRWRYRLFLVAGFAVAAVGVLYVVTGPGRSEHFHDNPTPGDLHSGGGVLLVVLGGALCINGWFLRNRDG